jgi:hypothetical protein
MYVLSAALLKEIAQLLFRSVEAVPKPTAIGLSGGTRGRLEGPGEFLDLDWA